MRRLPDIDLARAAVVPSDMAIRQLRQLKSGHPPHTFNPLRKRLLDIFNVEAGALGSGPRTEWSIIAREIEKEARFPAELDANLLAAQALHCFAEQRGIVGRQHTFFPMAVGISERIACWTNAILSHDGSPLVVFIDPRRARCLTAEARRFVLSVMHERIRVADLDYADVQLGILQFKDLEAEEQTMPSGAKKSPRIAELHCDAGQDLYGFDELSERIRATYLLWEAVLNERDDDWRRSGTGGLFG